MRSATSPGTTGSVGRNSAYCSTALWKRQEAQTQEQEQKELRNRLREWSRRDLPVANPIRIRCFRSYHFSIGWSAIMQYSRAGLVVLVFSLIISFVSAVPIPATESGLLSSRSVTLNGDDITASLRIPEHSLSGRKSTHFAATTGRTNTRGVR